MQGLTVTKSYLMGKKTWLKLPEIDGIGKFLLIR